MLVSIKESLESNSPDSKSSPIGQIRDSFVTHTDFWKQLEEDLDSSEICQERISDIIIGLNSASTKMEEKIDISLPSGSGN